MSDSDSAPQKRCNRCKQFKPATSEFFTHDRSKKDSWRTICRVCDKTPPETLPPIPEGYKRCRECKEIKLATTQFFNAIPAYVSKDCLNRQCIECRKKYRRGYNKDTEKAIKPKDEKKWCPKCKREWPATLEYFPYDKSTGDRLRVFCKQCSNKRSKTYRARPGGKEARQAYRQKHREHDRTYTKSYHMQHREYERQYRKHYRTTDNYRQSQFSYKHSEKARMNKRIGVLHRIALKKSVQGTHTAAQVREQLKRQKYRCYYAACGHAKFKKDKTKTYGYDFHVDHTFPLTRIAGTDIPGNDMSYLVLACPSCNLSKGKRFPWEWIEGGRLL